MAGRIARTLRQTFRNYVRSGIESMFGTLEYSSALRRMWLMDSLAFTTPIAWNLSHGVIRNG